MRTAPSPACGSTRRRPTPARISGVSGPIPARCWRRRHSAARPRRAGSRSTSGHRSRSPRTPLTWCRITPTRATTASRRRLHVGGCGQRAVARARERGRRREWRLSVRGGRVSDQLVQRHQLLGGRRFPIDTRDTKATKDTKDNYDTS